ncbi:iron-containing alcohol dehydrogenase [Aspergillus mulundensis]|uniref:Uncharacterized protein n=1 Tax=Aspergillus mulundensis TaxID=1810919 RepID=A0A3D8SUH4_9EURO|nr:Uncharacterized protein DSM5745_01748 [Aspergillus mulundensis]RDW89973.1 Uncharacterized protein DSM5745_01748 [Aspergillus mulundensis]
MDSSPTPTSGVWKPNGLQALHYGPGAVQQHIRSLLPSPTSRAFIVTGNSLSTKTPLIKQLESWLTPSHHAATCDSVKEHAPIAQIDEATTQVLALENIDTIISVGGGSPIDTAKAISHRVHEKSGSASFLHHIAIPTTLSAAECTFGAGYTRADGTKTGIAHSSLAPSVIIYDPHFTAYTPPSLFASTGLRALDHAIELQYHPTATLPCQWACLSAVRELFDNLPKYLAHPRNDDVMIRLCLAAFASLGFLGLNAGSGLGLSHTLGYALGSPYGIPHGITSCMTLGRVVKLKARADAKDAAAIAKVLDHVPGAKRSGNDLVDAEEVGDRILALVDQLGFTTTLAEKGVDRSEIENILAKCALSLPDQGRTEAGQKTLGAIRELVKELF